MTAKAREKLEELERKLSVRNDVLWLHLKFGKLDFEKIKERYLEDVRQVKIQRRRILKRWKRIYRQLRAA